MNYVISGKVIRGDGYGRKIGFPTVNLETEKSRTEALPPEGVYRGTVMLNTEFLTYKAGIVIGPNEKIEAHLIGYKGDAYGKQVTLEIQKFLRKYKKFETNYC